MISVFLSLETFFKQNLMPCFPYAYLANKVHLILQQHMMQTKTYQWFPAKEKIIKVKKKK